MRDDGLVKYPRTIHLEGSRLQDGDNNDMLSFQSLIGKHVVLEEKMDGANCGVSFGPSDELLLQSRGHFLTGGGSERHFNLLKEWAVCHQDALYSVLGQEYIMYGEWMYAKHSVFYDLLPHYFLEFDLFEKSTGQFLSTKKRHDMLKNFPVVSVPVLFEGIIDQEMARKPQDFLQRLVVPSLAKSDHWQGSLDKIIASQKLDQNMTWKQTDKNTSCEGLYGKIEEGDYCVGRFKYVRHSFTQSILDEGTHWKKRPLLPNKLKDGQNIYAPTIDKSWPKPKLVELKTSKKLKK